MSDAKYGGTGICEHGVVRACVPCGPCEKARAEAAEKRVTELENEIFGEMVRSDYRSIADIRNAVKLAEAQRDTYREALEVELREVKANGPSPNVCSIIRLEAALNGPTICERIEDE